MDNNKNGLFKPKRVYFSQVSNHALRDNTLSLKAKGLYALIQSYITIENFTLYKNTLKKACLEGNTAFESGWKELKDKGYLVQEKHQNLDGTFYYLYDLLDLPIHTPKTEGVDDAGGGNGGSYNNTHYNNTNLNNTNLIEGYKGSTNVQRYDFSFDVLDIQIEKIMNTISNNGVIGNLDTNDIKEFFRMYYNYGGHMRNIKPTKLKNEQIENIITSISYISKADYNPSLDDYKKILIDYFNQDFPNCDYGINHFISGDVLLMRYYNLRPLLE